MIRGYFFVSFIISVLGFILSPSALSAEEEEVALFHIGAVLPLSGAMAFAGDEARKAINLALSEEQNLPFKLRVTFEDNGPGAVATATAVNKLLLRDRVDALITLWPESANIAAPITERQGVLHYTIAWDPNIACSNNLVLSHQVTVNDYVRATLSMLKERGIRKLVFFHDTVFQQGADILAELASGYGVTIEKVFTFDRGKSDFRAELTKTRNSEYDGLLIWSVTSETEIFLRQLNQFAVDKFVTGFFDVVQNLNLIEGMEFVSEVYATKEFQDKFFLAYGDYAVMKGPNAYDVIKLLSRALEQEGNGKPTSLALRDRLLKVTDYSGAVGRVSIDNCGNSSYPVLVKRVVSGKLQTSNYANNAKDS